jgi:hypothetical protein
VVPLRRGDFAGCSHTMFVFQGRTVRRRFLGACTDRL